MSHRVYDNGVWKEANGTWVYDSGVWKPVDAGWVYDAGIWKPFHVSVEGFVYVGGGNTANANSNIIRRIDVSNMSTDSDLVLPAPITYLHRSSDDFIYAGLNTGAIHKIDLTTFTSIGSVSAGAGEITSLTTNDTGSFLWAGTNGNAYKIDTASMSLSSTYIISSAPHVAWAPGNKIFISNNSVPRLERWDAVGNTFETSASNNSQIASLMTGGNGDIYLTSVSESITPYIAGVTKRINPTTMGTVSSVNGPPSTLAWNYDTNALYMSGYNPSSANSFLDYRSENFALITAGGSFSVTIPVGLIVGPGGYLYQTGADGFVYRRNPITLGISALGSLPNWGVSKVHIV